MFLPEDVQDSIFATLDAERARNDGIRATANPDIASRVGEIHRMFPDLPAGLKLAAAKRGIKNDMLATIAERTAVVNANPAAVPQENDNKSIWERAYSGLKGASRWTLATANFPLDVVQGGVAQIFDPGGDISGWVISTDIGSMIANNSETGSGFTIGGRAKELQAERARRYRGTIDGHAYTMGRGTVGVLPGNLDSDKGLGKFISGFIDAAAAILVPFDAGLGDVGKAARILEESGKGGKLVSTVADISRTVGKGSREIGISRATADEISQIRALARMNPIAANAIDYSTINRFFGTRFGQRLIERVAETKDFTDTWELFGRQIDPILAKELADATDVVTVKNILLDQLGLAEGLRTTDKLKGGKLLGLRSMQYRDSLLSDADVGDFWTGVRRAKAYMPKTRVGLYGAETTRDMIVEMDNLDRVTKLFGFSPDVRRQVLNKAADLLANKNLVETKKFYDELDNLYKQTLIDSGASKELIESIWGRWSKFRDDTRLYAVDDVGNPDDAGFYDRVFGTGSGSTKSVFVGPQLTSDLLNADHIIPDPREVKRVLSQWNWFFVAKDPNLDKLRKAGQLRMIPASIDAVNRVWRQGVTLTFGNHVRNVVDSLLSTALTTREGTVGLFNHPMEWLALVLPKKFGKRGMGDIFGQDFGTLARENSPSDALAAYRSMMRKEIHRFFEDPLAPYRRMQRLGTFKQYDRAIDGITDRFAVARAHGDVLGKMNADWAMRSLANGSTPQEVFDLIKTGLAAGETAKTNQAIKWFEEMKAVYGDSQLVLNTATKRVTKETVDLSNDQNLLHLIETRNDMLLRYTGHNPDLLRGVVGQGRLPRIDVEPKRVSGELKIGGRVEFVSPNGKKAMGTIVDQNATTGDWVIEPFAFTGGENTDELLGLLESDRIFQDPKMPRRMVSENRNPNTQWGNSVKIAWDGFINAFHQYLYEIPVGKLERSPMFRSFYYKHLDKFAQSMDEASLRAVIADVETAATAAKVAPENYLTPDLWKKLKDLEANPDRLYGTITREQASAFASGAALDDMKAALYDATDRRNMYDFSRVISPFATQWEEFLTRMGRIAFTPTAVHGLRVPNIAVARRLQLGMKAGEFDPEGDGKGIFYVDPQTGQWSFSFPLSGELTKALTGINAPISAPVKGLSMGLDYRPGLGPFATIAMSYLLPDRPETDWIRHLLLPYGEKTSVAGALIPSWIQKVAQGLSGSEGGKYFAMTYAETMQALAASEKYDLGNPEQRAKMFEDARSKARVLTILRGVTQFTGPAAGRINIKVLTKEGDVFTALLSNEYQKLRDADYDSATMKFIELFGENVFPYMANKTQSLVGGQESTKAFGDFERTNKKLFAAYRQVAGYFAPVGTDFDKEVFARQIAQGTRERLPAEELLKAGERIIAQAYYNEMKRSFGDKITGDERSYLSDYRDKLEKKYPGFAESDYDLNKIPTDIDSFFSAARTLENNKVAEAGRIYEQARNIALAGVDKLGTSLAAKKGEEWAQWLDAEAQAIIAKYPEFGRVYDRLLSRELGL